MSAINIRSMRTLYKQFRITLPKVTTTNQIIERNRQQLAYYTNTCIQKLENNNNIEEIINTLKISNKRLLLQELTISNNAIYKNGQFFIKNVPINLTTQLSTEVCEFIISRTSNNKYNYFNSDKYILWLMEAIINQYMDNNYSIDITDLAKKIYVDIDNIIILLHNLNENKIINIDFQKLTFTLNDFIIESLEGHNNSNILYKPFNDTITPELKSYIEANIKNIQSHTKPVYLLHANIDSDTKNHVKNYIGKHPNISIFLKDIDTQKPQYFFQWNNDPADKKISLANTPFNLIKSIRIMEQYQLLKFPAIDLIWILPALYRYKNKANSKGYISLIYSNFKIIQNDYTELMDINAILLELHRLGIITLVKFPQNTVKEKVRGKYMFKLNISEYMPVEKLINVIKQNINKNIVFENKMPPDISKDSDITNNMPYLYSDNQDLQDIADTTNNNDNILINKFASITKEIEDKFCILENMMNVLYTTNDKKIICEMKKNIHQFKQDLLKVLFS